MKNQTKNLILKNAAVLFYSSAINHVTLDDIASKSGISKKTIYKYFENKEDLVIKTIRKQAKILKKNISRIQQKGHNALEELMHFITYINKKMHRVYPMVKNEIKKGPANSFFNAINYSDTIILQFIVDNIENGKQQGLYKEQIDAQAFCESYDVLSKSIYFNYYFTDLNVKKKSFEFVSSLFLYGLVTQLGLDYLQLTL
ncbi:hypothetical protein FFWV33_03940 [Flavobacterium faecale]|uniref:Uncharacterized protein n=1 Tax=Flavobacterium faecale TaxID=1355330 RepID=A0A2S1LAG8_9FLAO|nr:TetR/AcrR family transcriptional regulator [Flavobacterium faecale]AWG20750.1 hypothetical protein FFWV33_03940 [Flavobacterium faecale]